jgi:GNAT superfamily N-acetyltransferase
MSPVIRERRLDDVPVLARLLGEQQASSSYPVRWPLPFPVEDFLVRRTEERAWVAELDGQVVGHVSAGRLDGELRDQFVEAAGTEDLAEIAVLFVATDVLGTGVGGLLIDTAVAWIRASGRMPVLDVVPAHDRALAVYRRRGWEVVGESRPAFLGADHPPLILMVLGDRPSHGGRAGSTRR